MTYDIILDPNTIEIQADEAGDFLLGDVINNYILYIVVSNPGDWKQFPLIGVGIYGFLQAVTSPARIEQAIIKQLKSDTNGSSPIFPNPLVDAKNFPVINVNGVKIEVGNV